MTETIPRRTKVHYPAGLQGLMSAAAGYVPPLKWAVAQLCMMPIEKSDTEIVFLVDNAPTDLECSLLRSQGFFLRMFRRRSPVQ
jgi:hypothetical protein